MTAFTLLTSLNRRVSGVFVESFGVIHDPKNLLATPSPLPGFLPGCLIMTSTTAEEGYAIAGIIASIIHESGEYPIDTSEIEGCILKRSRNILVLFAIIYWAKRRKYKEDQNWLMRKIYGDALIYYLISLGKYYYWLNWHLIRGTKLNSNSNLSIRCHCMVFH